MFLLVAFIGWLVSQVGKYLIHSVQVKSFKDWGYLYRSGSMPSAHTSIIVSLVTYTGLIEGVTSSVFALGVVVAAIVMYDAMQVRRSVGEQGRAIEEIIKNSHIKRPYIAMGHRPSEVAVGATLGLLVGIVAFFITK
ncbi:MAG TPA: divergent PAP2 family protein [Verrucomicrobiae bacterium]|nr:divergent PAP2 family protein [Verrucomicrobiae bacterium]